MPVPPTNSGYKKPEDITPTPEVKTEDDNLDDLGYEIEPEVKTEELEPKVEDKPAVVEEDKVITKATGYGEEEETTDDKKPDEDKDKTPEDQKTDEQKAAETLEKEIDESLGKLPEGYNKESVKEFAVNSKLTKEQVDNYVETVKNDNIRIIENNRQLIKERNARWTNNLKNDVEFSGENGENFTKSVNIADKMLDAHMPNLKKHIQELNKNLTEGKEVLPDYVMKDLKKLHRTLNPTTGLVEGEAPKVEEKEINDLDAMYE